jgi:gas vesicle protein
MCGAAAGAAAAIFFAPKPGNELRRDVIDGASRLRQTAQDKYSQTSDVVADWVNRSRRAVNEGKRAFMSAKPNGMDMSV